MSIFSGLNQWSEDHTISKSPKFVFIRSIMQADASMKMKDNQIFESSVAVSCCKPCPFSLWVVRSHRAHRNTTMLLLSFWWKQWFHEYCYLCESQGSIGLKPWKTVSKGWKREVVPFNCHVHLMIVRKKGHKIGSFTWSTHFMTVTTYNLMGRFYYHCMLRTTCILEVPQRMYSLPMDCTSQA